MYNHVISLGGACDVAHHVRRVFDIEAAQFFDWQITPFDALRAAIDADLAGVGDSVTLRKNRGTVIDNTYRIHLHHAFSRGPDGLITQETVEREHRAALEKIDFLRRRWIDTLARGEPILFVVRHDVGQADLEALHDLLAAKTAGPFHLLCLRGAHETQDGFAERPGLSHDVVIDTKAWTGDAASWDRALGRFRYQPPPRETVNDAAA